MTHDSMLQCEMSCRSGEGSMLAALQVKPPRIQQSAIHFECKLVHTYPVKNKYAPPANRISMLSNLPLPRQDCSREGPAFWAQR